jgi:thioesterase domain-containing protein
MAEEYIEAIRAVQSQGPYRIGGYSAGGVVAFEMAHQLRNEGQSVTLLALLDTFCPTLHGEDDRSVLKSLIKHVEGLRKGGWDYLKKYARGRVEFEQNRLRRMAVGIYEAMNRPLPIELRDIPMIDAYHEAVKIYDLTVYPGRAVLFTATERNHRRGDAPDHMGWEPFIGELEIHRVAGSHDDLMLEPNVQQLAMKLEMALSKQIRSGS